MSDDTLQWIVLIFGGTTFALALVRPVGKHLQRAQLALGAGIGLLAGHQLFGATETLLVAVIALLAFSISSFGLSMVRGEIAAARRKT
jgi:hypothetical protein